VGTSTPSGHDTFSKNWSRQGSLSHIGMFAT
jgi:hypothetical protein